MIRTTQNILEDVKVTLQTAQLGLDMVKGKDPEKRMAGLRNMVVFGRAVTNVLQNLRGSVGKEIFDKWYQPRVEKMEDDQILKYLYKLRSQILKKGNVNTFVRTSFSGDPAALMRKYKSPPRARNFFMGDSLGGCGWEVEIDEGITEKFYVDVPDNIEGLKMKISIHFSDISEELGEHSIQELGEYYLNYLGKLISEAKSVFM